MTGGRTRRRAIYLGTVLATVVMVAGLSLGASLSPSAINRAHQQVTDTTVTTSNITGLTYVGYGAGITGNLPGVYWYEDVVLGGGYWICLTLTGCENGNLSENVQFSFGTNLAANSGGTFFVDAYLGSYPTPQRVTFELSEPSPPVSGGFGLAWDLGNSSAVGNISIVMESCPSGCVGV